MEAVPPDIRNGPVQLMIPAAAPPIDPPVFKVKPPVPTFTAKAEVQLAVPLIVSERQAPGFPFIVTVRPEQMITLSAAVGMLAAAVPPHPTIDQVAGVFQFPLVRE
jgi:hypothetical protein